jgi:hypothetical protein
MYEFELILNRELIDEEIDEFWEVTGGDGGLSFGGADGNRAGFGREGRTLVDTVIDAIEQVETISDVRVTGVDLDPLVNIQEIAERTGRTRESIRLLINGDRGPGDFPAPALGSAPGRRLWRWSEVGIWLGEGVDELVEAQMVAQALNGWLALRNVLPKVVPPLRVIGEELAKAA